MSYGASTGEPGVHSAGWELAEQVDYYRTFVKMAAFPVIVLGNSLVLVCICVFKRLQTYTNAFVASLALGDLLVALFIPYDSIFEFSDVLNPYKYACLFRYTFVIVSFAASLFNLLLISFDRYLCILHPLAYPRYVTKRTTCVGICLSWMAGVNISLPPLVGYNTWTPAVMASCEYRTIYTDTYMYLVSFVGLISLSVTSAFYVAVMRAARAQRRKIHAVSVGHSHSHSQADLRQKDVKKANVMGVVMGIFFVCWLPYFIVSPIRISVPTASMQMARDITVTLAYLNSCANCIIYGLISKEFRWAYRTLLKRPSCSKKKKSKVLNTTQTAWSSEG